MTNPFMGEIRMVGFGFPPRDWYFCRGQLLNISQNTALFSLLGTIYGGNGTTTFALPDLQGRVPVHFGQGPGLTDLAIGETRGQESVTLLTTEMATHNHAAGAATTADARDPRGTLPAPSTQNRFAATSNTTMHANAVATAGGGQPHSNMAPYLAMNYVIAAAGVFPARN